MPIRHLRSIFLGVIAVLALAGSVTQSVIAQTNYPEQVINLINQRRAEAGLLALQPCFALMLAAQGHSTDMATHDFMDHRGSDGSNPGDRITRAGYNWTSYGETVAAGYSTPADVVQGWMSSPGHHAILMGNYQHIGAGYAYNANTQYGHYWTVDVATSSSNCAFPSIPTLTPTATPTRTPTPTAAPIWTPTPTATPPPSASLSGRVLLQSRLSAQGTNLLLDGQLVSITQSDGQFVLNSPAGESHTLQAIHTSYLGAQYTFSLQAGQTLNLPDVLLPGGEVNGNNQINIQDLTIAAAGYRTSPPSDPRADINADNRIDIRDLVIIGSNYGRNGPIPWPVAGATGLASDNEMATVIPRLTYRSVGQIDVGLWIEGAPGLQGADLHVQFDPQQGKVDDVNPAEPGIQIQPGDLVGGPGSTYVLENVANNQTGDIYYASVRLGPAPGTRQDGNLVQFTFDTVQGRNPLSRLGLQIFNSAGDAIPIQVQSPPGTPQLQLHFHLPLVSRMKP